MTDESTVEPGAQASEPSTSTLGRILPSVLIGLATILAVVSIFSTWIRVQALDTDKWVPLSDELLQDPAIQEPLSAYVVDVLYEKLDVAADIEGGLPEDLRSLAGPLTAALRAPAANAVERLIASEQFRSTWLEANRLAHQTLINVLRDDAGTALSTSDGSVVLELGDLIRVAGEKLGLSESLLDRLPADAGRITIFESADLANAQSAVQVLDFMSWFTLLLVVALYVSAVYLATGRRLRVLRNVGVSMFGGGLAAFAISGIATRVAIGALVENPAGRPVAEATARIGTRLIREMCTSAAIYGLLVIGFASLLGDHRWARAIRGAVAPAFSASAGAIAAAAAGFVLLLIWWSPGSAFDRWVTALMLVALVAGAVVALRRAILSETPAVRLDDASA